MIVLTGQAHANRRRLWNRGLSTESLRQYESVLADRVKQLMDHLTDAALLDSVDLSRSIGYFTFDFMGDMAYVTSLITTIPGAERQLNSFGGPFHMLSDGGDRSGFWYMLEKFAVYVYDLWLLGHYSLPFPPRSAASIISHIPWVFPIIQNIPLLSRDLKRLRKFGLELATGRMQSGGNMKDLWWHLVCRSCLFSISRS